MRAMRLVLAGTVILALLGGLSVVVVAQSDAERSVAGAPEELFEITLSPEVLPTELGFIIMQSVTFDPGLEASIVDGDESFRARALYIDSGELLIEPIHDALVWRQEDAHGGSPRSVPAAEPTMLVAGDLIFLPAIPLDAVDPSAAIGLANPDTEPVVAHGFHTHLDGGRSGTWPLGVTGSGIPSHSDPTEMERVQAAETVFRLSRTIVDPGMPMTIVGGPSSALYLVASGGIEGTMSGPGGELRVTWPAGKGSIVPPASELTYDLTSVGAERAELLTLEVMPADT